MFVPKDDNYYKDRIAFLTKKDLSLVNKIKTQINKLIQLRIEVQRHIYGKWEEKDKSQRYRDSKEEFLQKYFQHSYLVEFSDEKYEEMIDILRMSLYRLTKKTKEEMFGTEPIANKE